MDDYDRLMPKPLPKEQTPAPIKLGGEDKLMPKPLPKEKTPAPIKIESKTEEPAPEPTSESSLESTSEPTSESTTKSTSEPVQEPKKSDSEKLSEKPDPNALAEALIMAHQNKARASSKSKKNVISLVILLFSLIVVIAVLAVTGIINLDFSTLFGGGGKPSGDTGAKIPSVAVVREACESRGLTFTLDTDTSAYIIGGEELDGKAKKYICELKTDTPDDSKKSSSSDSSNKSDTSDKSNEADSESEPDETEETKEIKELDAELFFYYMVLDQDYDTIDGLQAYFDDTEKYFNVLSNSDGFYKGFRYNSDTYTYLVAYKSSIIELISDDHDVIEDILVEMKFPNRFQVDV